MNEEYSSRSLLLDSNIEMTEENRWQAVAPSTDRWKPIFRDPTFGGECIPLPAKERSEIVRSASYSSDAIFEDLPMEVRCMVSTGNSPEPAGSPVKAAQYLRRFSAESDRSESSALSDITSSMPNTGRSVEEQPPKKMSVKSKESKNSGSGFTPSPLASPELVREESERSKSKSSGFSDVSAASKREKPVVSETADGAQNDNDEKDPDLLSNPYATDSEQD